MLTTRKSSGETRVQLTEQIFEKLLRDIYKGDVSELSSEKGLPYALVYNLVHGRIDSLSAKDYRIIFGEEPPRECLTKVDGRFFREMVNLWLYLNEDVSKAELYREFFPNKRIKKTDYRIFSGQTKTIEARLERIMEAKFKAQGLERSEVKAWLQECCAVKVQSRVPYHDIKPILDFIKRTLDVHPSLILSQHDARYERGELKQVSEAVYENAIELKKSVERILKYGSRRELARLREEIYGKRKGLTLFSEVEEELEFLQTHAERRPKKYLGRSISNYRKGKLKRIASWRAEAIKQDFESLLAKKPEIKISSLPGFQFRGMVGRMTAVLMAVLKNRAPDEIDAAFETRLLAPAHYKKYYENEATGFTPFASASSILGMSSRAFDLLVSSHCDIIKLMGKYDERWYLPTLYLEEIREKRGFELVRMKYQALSLRRKSQLPAHGSGDICQGPRAPSETGKPSDPKNIAMLAKRAWGGSRFSEHYMMAVLPPTRFAHRLN
jgi:hypothetical protein